jgi:hypothetical protein
MLSVPKIMLQWMLELSQYLFRSEKVEGATKYLE